MDANCALLSVLGDENSLLQFNHYYKSIAKCAGIDFRDGAVVPFE